MKLFHKIKQHPYLAVLVLLALGTILFALIAPWLFATHSGSVAFNSETGAIGDTFGIMNPFVAIAAALITFAAFWVQYQANQSMLDENRKQQIITRFYEMLKIHRENVKELEWIQTIYSPKETNYLFPDEELSTKKGRPKFNYYLIEFDLIYRILDILAPKLKKREKITTAYSIFYYGGKNNFFDYELRNKLFQTLAKTDKNVFSEEIKNIFASYSNSEKIASIIEILFQNRKYFISQPPFFGHFEELHNYYRHLFLTVKTVANEDEKNISHFEKRELLSILRAQLSYREQIMLFYNWFSGNDSEWEETRDDGNHFFTKYRMIHDIVPHLMVPFKNAAGETHKAYVKFIRYFSYCKFAKNYGTNDDPIFEFENDENFPRFNYDK